MLDDAAVLAAMCYVDLNPIRAGLYETWEGSDFTSVQERIELRRPGSTSFKRETIENMADEAAQPAPLMSFQAESGIDKPSNAAPAEHSTGHLQPVLPTTLPHHLALVDWTGRQVRKDKCGYIPDDLAPLLSRLGVDEKEGVRTVMEFNKRFRFAAGALGKLEQWCHAVGRQWIQGRKAAAKWYVQPA